MTNRWLSLGAGVLLAAGASTQAMADGVADFYRGRTLSLVVGLEVGTGYDTYARVLARHLSRHIPGNPNIVVQNMVGASGIVASNWLYNVAPRDGTVMATIIHTAPFEPIMGNAAAKYDPTKFTWITNLDESVGICGVSKASGIEKFEDLQTKEGIFGGTGAAGSLSKYPLAIKNLLGFKVKRVSGYSGSGTIKLAIQRGELSGVCGLSLSTMTSQWDDDYKSGNFKPIVQLSGQKKAELKDIPHIDEYAKSDEDRQVFSLIFGTQALGRVLMSPPAMPVDRRQALRNGVLATIKDSAFIDEAVKAQIDISPMTGDEVEAFIARLSSVSPAAIQRAKQAVRPE